MPIPLRPIMDLILQRYRLPLGGNHGVAHWARVLENGMLLASETGANVDVVRLFAVLHDSRRINEYGDPEHGPRAAEFVEELFEAKLLPITKQQYRRLHYACWGHTHELTHEDVTIQTCWDADRLDLGRVGIEPDPDRLSTDFAKLRSTIRWADGRASMHFVPDWIAEDWGVELAEM